MDIENLRCWIKRNYGTIKAAARFFDMSPRSFTAILSGEKRIPKILIMACKTKELSEEVERLEQQLDILAKGKKL